MSENACAARPQEPGAPSGAPSPQTCLQVARQAAILAVTAADDAMTAVCHSRSGAAARLEAVMQAAHQAAVEAESWADRAEEYAADPAMPSSSLAYCAREAVAHAVRAQSAAGVAETAADLRAELERKLTAAEYAERESARRREEAQQEAEERTATGMDRENRDRAALNRHLAERHVAELGWTAGHVRVLEAAETGRLYWRGGRARQAARRGAWAGGRRVSRERTQALYAARFLVAVRQDDDTRVLTPSPMGQAALELARLHPAGLHAADQAAYEARFAKVRRHHKRRDDQKAAARRLPPLESSARRLYQRPVTLAEQEVLAERAAADQWEDEGGHCPGAGTPRPASRTIKSAPESWSWAEIGPAVQPALW
ncbi:hypothetical protein C9F11_20955 [Streptomyces sp. YIM 121038]|uniref:hypothetical protein n=1 Tax=Streptomyces sp. YIM 121038 TaxID=2136401 RepID=UPI001110A38E|nr:hypothetical protein [Streptomyces sp. YIM 121038]QCX77823.1 hypothetical protein C9F11_20955 [Streptomyces sp. YIM 121038]